MTVRKPFDTIIKGETVVTATDRFRSDIGGALRHGVVRMFSPATSVRRIGDEVEATTLDHGLKARIRARHAVVATTADVAAELLDDGPAAVRDAMPAIRYGPFLTVVVLRDESAPMPFDGSYAIAPQGCRLGCSSIRPARRESDPASTGAASWCFAQQTAPPA